MPKRGEESGSLAVTWPTTRPYDGNVRGDSHVPAAQPGQWRACRPSALTRPLGQVPCAEHSLPSYLPQPWV